MVVFSRKEKLRRCLLSCPETK